MRELVMNGLELADFPAPELMINPMSMVFVHLKNVPDAICYTFNNYKEMQARKPDSEVPKIAIDNIFPDERTVKNGTYPFISKLHIAIRSDLDRKSMAYKLYEWLQSENAKHTIAESGFILK
jgi:phosphate transport system substrate-binding protein